MSLIYRMTPKEYYSQPGFKRLLNKVFKKYIGLERVGGNVTIEKLDAEESQTLTDFFGRLIRPGDIIEVPLKQFVMELNRGYQLTIPELYEVLEGRPLLTYTEQRQLKEQQWTLLFQTVNEYAKNKYNIDLLQGPFANAIYNWFSRLRQGQALGYRVLQNVFRQDVDKACEELSYCIDALWFLQNKKQSYMQSMGSNVPWIRLPVFATIITNDAHAFDGKRSLGRLFWSALADINSRSLQSEELLSFKNLGDALQINRMVDVTESMNRRHIYRKVGLKDDDISSDVLVFAQPFTQLTSISKLTLRQIEMMSVWPEYSALYVVENPSVFSTLVDEASELLKLKKISFEQVPSDFPIAICTSGQPSDAANLFIRNCLIANTGCKMYYSGDFDLAGVQIAIGIENRFTNAFQEWHMDSETYIKYAKQGLNFSDEEKSQLKRLQVQWSSDIGIDMEKQGIKCYHEAIIHELITDWINAVSQSLEIK